MPYWTSLGRKAAPASGQGRWDATPVDEVTAVLAQLGKLFARVAVPRSGARVLSYGLPFYPGYTLYEFVDLNRQPRLPAYAIVGPGGAWPLDWTNRPVMALNASGALALDDGNVADYLRFYLSHVTGRHGRFLPLESADVRKLEDFAEAQQKLLEQHAKVLVPRTDDTGGYRFDTVVVFKQSLFRTPMSVAKDGIVSIGDPQQIGDPLPIAEDIANEIASQSDAPFDPIGGWLTLNRLDTGLRSKLKGIDEIAGSDRLKSVDLAFQKLSFFADVVLARIAPPGPKTGFGLYGLWSEHGLWLLRGRSKDIFETIERESFRLDDSNVLDYLKFFCTFVHGDDGPFRVVTRAAELNTTAELAKNGALPMHDLPVEFGTLSKEALGFVLRAACRGTRKDEKGPWPARAILQYAGSLAIGNFEVSPDGPIQMIDDRCIASNVPVDKRLDKMLLPSAVATCIGGAAELAELIREASIRSAWPAYLNERELEASVLRECVRVQLVHALRSGDGAPLFEAPPDADDDALLVAFANFLFDVCPVVVIESRTPYIERLVSALLVDRVEHSPRFKTVGASPYESGQGMIDGLKTGDFWQISLHEWYAIRRPEAVAHKLGTTNSITVIGCDAQSAVPEPLRRITDVVVVLDNLDEDLFHSTFCGLFNCEWPQDGDDDDRLWQRYVSPGDFYQPVRSMLEKRGTETDWSPREALAAIRERVVERLSPIGASDGPALNEVHGLGEARQILLDLIADVRAAANGEIPWDAMDRGLLLVGEPGTGKTMLARAMAKDCGVRFIQASEARWMAGTSHLGQHIREIRATFAEARRYAPSILFIDELDSIGNRDLFAGKNRQYCVEIVNALLQELEGVDGRDGVFVIGATNYLARVDPALMRAGRLDQVVRIRRPNRAALDKILQFHLRRAMADGRIADDVDCHALAALALGSTGADIEFFVRDALRRARKDGSARVGQNHLAAAITRAPRSARSMRPVTPDEQARTAVHEAGHTLAMLLCDHYPAKINMVSIIPRSDGSLGFTGFVPDERSILTRREFEECLQVLLAGRAAEELDYGADGVSSGAGGSSGRNDLALATRLASQLVCQLGMGKGATLRWREKAMDAEEIAAIGGMLDNAYREVRAALTEHRPLLDALRDRLLDNHEVFATEVYSLAATYGVGPDSEGRDDA